MIFLVSYDVSHMFLSYDNDDSDSIFCLCVCFPLLDPPQMLKAWNPTEDMRCKRKMFGCCWSSPMHGHNGRFNFNHILLSGRSLACLEEICIGYLLMKLHLSVEDKIDACTI